MKPFEYYLASKETKNINELFTKENLLLHEPFKTTETNILFKDKKSNKEMYAASKYQLIEHLITPKAEGKR